MLSAAALFWALGSAQARPAPAPVRRLTATQVIEKSIEAAGGRAALAGMTTTLSKGFMRIKGHEEHSLMEFYAKAPNKRLVVTNIEGFGETRQGFDGTVGWRQDATGAVTELRGQELAAARSEAAFNPTLRWRDVYTKAVLKGKTKVGARDAWVVVFTEKNGTPATRYYDAETFLLVRQTVRVKTGAGPLDITVDLSDYRDAGGGVKAPFRMIQKTPGFGEITVEMTEIRNNAEIEDATFSKPAPPPDKK